MGRHPLGNQMKKILVLFLCAFLITPVFAAPPKTVSVNFDDTPFSDVLEWLREEGVKNLVVRWQDLLINGATEDTLVTLILEDVTVSVVLNEVLEQMSDNFDPIRYVQEENILRIGTKSHFDLKLYTRVYPVTDLLMKVRSFRGAPEIDLEQQQQSGGGGGQGGQAQVQSIFGQGGGGGGSNDDDDDEDTEERENELMDKLEAVVVPLSWFANGGLGRMVIVNRNLIVYNTREAHEVLAGYFER